MVLGSATMRGLLLGLLVVGMGCVPKTPPVTLATQAPVTVAMVFDAAGTAPPAELPQTLQDVVLGELTARNLGPVIIGSDAYAQSFGARRATPQRMQWLAGQADGGYVLLLEAQVEYYNQIGSMYRWTVSFRATMGGVGDSYPVDTTFEVPVFLRFAHEKEAEALAAAMEVARRRVARLADSVLGAAQQSAREARGADAVVEGVEPATGAPEGGAQPGLPPDGGPGDEVRDGVDADALGPIYFVLVDRFWNGDPSNDGQVDVGDPQAFHGGDLAGVRQKLDYLQGLGIKTVWLSPVFKMRTEKIGEWGAFHGYWVTGEPMVEPRFGTLEELVGLREDLHRRGMKLLLDVVANHVGYDSVLLEQHPDWFHGEGDILDWSDEVQATTHDVHGLPDLRHEDPEVRKLLIDQARYWIDTVAPDGFRLDAVRHVPLDFWAEYNDAVRAHAGEDFVLLGELFDGDPAEVDRFWSAGHFSHMFDFPLHYALLDVVCGEQHPGRLAAILDQDFRYEHPERLVTFVDNHDLPRVASRCSRTQVGTALELLGALRGVPAIFAGTEFGLDGAEEPANRADVPWGRGPMTGLQGLVRRHREASRARGWWGRIASLGGDGLCWERLALGKRLLGCLRRTGTGDEISLELAEPRPIPEDEQERQFAVVAFEVVAEVGAGEELRLVGAADELGHWDPSKGVALVRSGDAWEAQVVFPPERVLEYKLVVLGEGPARWEQRSNRYLRAADAGWPVHLRWEQ